MAKDYKSLQRLNEGDIISAEVFNDILARIELTLKSATAKDLLGTWNLVQTTCSTGALGNCSTINPIFPPPSGFSSPVDNLYKQRLDVVSFTDDEDGTFSYQTTNHCAFVRAGTGNSPCSGEYAVVDGRFILNSNGFVAYTLRKVSDTRIILGLNNNGSGSFNIIRLDKKIFHPNLLQTYLYQILPEPYRFYGIK